MFQKDEKLINELIAKKLEEMNKDVDTDVDLVYEAMEHLWKTMSFNSNETISRFLDFLRFCMGNNSLTSSTNVAADTFSHTEKQQKQTQNLMPESSVLAFGATLSLEQSVSTDDSNLPSHTLLLPSYSTIHALDPSPSTQSSVEMVLSQHENYIYEESSESNA